jgi:hypothetical protein
MGKHGCLEDMPIRGSSKAPPSFPDIEDDISTFMDKFRRVAKKYRLDDDDKCDAVTLYMVPGARRRVKRTTAYKDRDWKGLKKKVLIILEGYDENDKLSYRRKQQKRCAQKRQCLCLPTKVDTPYVPVYRSLGARISYIASSRSEEASDLDSDGMVAIRKHFLCCARPLAESRASLLCTAIPPLNLTTPASRSPHFAPTRPQTTNVVLNNAYTKFEGPAIEGEEEEEEDDDEEEDTQQIAVGHGTPSAPVSFTYQPPPLSFRLLNGPSVDVEDTRKVSEFDNGSSPSCMHTPCPPPVFPVTK